jgi:parallel beta-helix repeat protein
MGTPLSLTSVPAQTPYIQYVATLAQTVFPYPFEITQDSDLLVVVNGVTQPTDGGYTLSGQGATNGGNVTFTTAPGAGAIVTLFRDIAIARATQIAQNSGFQSSTFNAEFNQIYLILQDLQSEINQCLQVPNTNNPAPVTTLTPGVYAGKYLSFDSNGNPTPALLTSSGTLTQVLIGELLQPQTPFEAAQGINPSVSLQYWPPGYLQRYGGVADSGTTDNTTALQNALTACQGACPVFVTQQASGAYFGNINGVVTMPVGSDLRFSVGARLDWKTVSNAVVWATATYKGALLAKANCKISGKGVISGPSANNTFTSLECGITAIGTSAASKQFGLEIRDVEIRNWGQFGVLLKWLQDVTLENTIIHDCGYGAFVTASCTNQVVTKNEVYNIHPGSAGNAYGLQFTFDSGAGSITNSRTDANHMPIGIECSENFVHDIPLWTGIGTHGSFEFHCHGNRIYNCEIPIQDASANTSPNVVGENSVIENNIIVAAQYNGGATGISSTHGGITVNGALTTALHRGVIVRGNVIDGYGTASLGGAASIQAQLCDNPVIDGNIIKNWTGLGVYLYGGTGGVVVNNTFGALNASFADSALIAVDGGQVVGGSSPLIQGNVHRIPSGTAAVFGILLQTAASGGADTSGLLIGPNDFASVTTLYGNFVGGALAPADIGFLTCGQLVGASFLVNTSLNGGLGFQQSVGAGSSVVQTSSRTNGVTINKRTGKITLVAAAGSATAQVFTVTNSTITAQDVVIVTQVGATTDKYQVIADVNSSGGSFTLAVTDLTGTTNESPAFNFAIICGATS